MKRRKAAWVLAGLLALFAAGGIVSECRSTIPSTPTATEYEVAEARRLLGEDYRNAYGETEPPITAAELAQACGYYADNAWSPRYARPAAIQDDQLRTWEVINKIYNVSFEIAFDPDASAEWGDWVAEKIGKPYGEWSEADHDYYFEALSTRLIQLIEAICEG